MGDIVQQACGGVAAGGGAVPERGRDDHDAWAFFADDHEPGDVVGFAVDADFDVALEADPEVGLQGVAVPGFDDAWVLHAEVDLALGAHDALHLVHHGPAAIVGEELRGDEDGLVVSLGVFVSGGKVGSGPDFGGDGFHGDSLPKRRRSARPVVVRYVSKSSSKLRIESRLCRSARCIKHASAKSGFIA